MMKDMKNLPYPIGMVLEEIDPEQAEGDNSPQTKKGPTMPRVPKGYQERILQGGSYICFAPQFPCRSGHLMEIYQQMEAGIFLKWYYENQLIISTTKEKIIRYKDGKLSFYLPLEM